MMAFFLVMIFLIFLFFIIIADALTYFIDLDVEQDYLQFKLFRVIKIKRLHYVDIKTIRKVSPWWSGLLVRNYTNRFFKQRFLIEQRKSFFYSRLIITPQDPDALIHAVRSHGLNV